MAKMAKWLFVATLLVALTVNRSFIVLGSISVLGEVYTVKDLECWTIWYDTSNPTIDGDFELIANIRNTSGLCKKRIEIEVQTVNGVSANATGQKFWKMDTENGFVCLNADQGKNGTCLDYKMRFRCSPAFCKNPKCWTSWFDRDDPSGSGDWENLLDLYAENPKAICEVPLDIDVRTVEGLTVNSTNDNLTFSKDNGLVCKATDNPQGCRDWKVRFLCPYNFCFIKECWTIWYASGSPTDLASWGVLAALKTNATIKNFCPKIILTQVKAMINTGAISKGKIYDDTGKFLANLYDNRDLTYDVRYMCNSASCNSTSTK